MKIEWEKIDEAIELALSAPFPHLAIHHLIDIIIEGGPPEEVSEDLIN